MEGEGHTKMVRDTKGRFENSSFYSIYLFKKERNESFLMFVMKSGGGPWLAKRFYSGFFNIL